MDGRAVRVALDAQAAHEPAGETSPAAPLKMRIPASATRAKSARFTRAPTVRRQGANGFATPRSAGSSSGKWRSSTVRIVLFSTQSSPACVYTSGR